MEKMELIPLVELILGKNQLRFQLLVPDPISKNAVRPTFSVRHAAPIQCSDSILPVLRSLRRTR